MDSTPAGAQRPIIDLAPPGLEIIAETRDWLAVNKPPLLQVHPSKPSHEGTMWHRLRELLAYELANGGQVSIINRLDRETSGITLIAKNRDAARRFSMLMERGRIAKQYIALVWGWPVEDRFAIDAPLLRRGTRGESRIYLKQCVHPDGAAARTEFEVMRRFQRDGSPFAMVRAFPQTGRMHQIRVHLAHAGHPVVGDKIYGPSEECYLQFIGTGWTPELAAVLLMRRHALHSALLEVPDEAVRCEAPLAPDMREFCQGNIA